MRTNSKTAHNNIDLDAQLAAIAGEITADEMLGDLNLDEELGAIEAANDEVAGDDNVLDDIEAELAVEEMKTSAYEAAPATGGHDEAAAAPTKRGRKGKKATAEGDPEPTETDEAPTTTRTRGTIEALESERFVLEINDADGDLDALKTNVIGLRPTAKKIGEKFDNLFLALAAGKKPSVYTMHGYNALKAADAAGMSGTDMVKAMEAAGMKIGTARSQGQQIMTLLTVTKIATRKDGRIYLNDQSVLADAIDALTPAGE